MSIKVLKDKNGAILKLEEGTLPIPGVNIERTIPFSDSTMTFVGGEGALVYAINFSIEYRYIDSSYVQVSLSSDSDFELIVEYNGSLYHWGYGVAQVPAGCNLYIYEISYYGLSGYSEVWGNPEEEADFLIDCCGGEYLTALRCNISNSCWEVLASE